MGKIEDRYTLKIMGIDVGTCSSWWAEDSGEDYCIQADEFEPFLLLTKVPRADTVSFHFISGKYKVWDGNGNVTQEGDIFGQINGA